MFISLKSYFITNPNGHMLNLPELKQVKSNLTTIRLMPAEDVEAQRIIEQWQKTKKYLNLNQMRLAKQVYSPNKLKVNPETCFLTTKY